MGSFELSPGIRLGHVEFESLETSEVAELKYMKFVGEEDCILNGLKDLPERSKSLLPEEPKVPLGEVTREFATESSIPRFESLDAALDTPHRISVSKSICVVHFLPRGTTPVGVPLDGFLERILGLVSI